MKDRKNILKFICGILIGGFILLSGSQCGRQVPPEAKSLVKIYTSEGWGTGVIFEITSEDMVIASNLHVITGWDENAYILMHDGKKVFGQQFGADEDYDVAFISVPISEFGEKGTEDYPVVEPAGTGESPEDDSTNDDSPVEKIDIRAYDVFSGKMPIKVTGKMESKTTYIYDMDRVMYLGNLDRKLLTEGMSGTGIFSDKGFWGILTAGNDEGVVTVTPYEDIVKCLFMLQ